MVARCQPQQAHNARFDVFQPMSSTDSADPLTQRLIQLEIKASFAEDLLDKLDQVVIDQQAQIDRLKRELQLLRQQTSTDADPTPRNMRDELPPHY